MAGEARAPSSVVIYARVSTDGQTDGTSIETQIAACTGYATRHGLSVAAVEVDPGVSGALLESRPAMMRAVDHVRCGRAGAVLALRMDRAGRSSEVLLDLRARVAAAGGKLLFADGFAPGDGAVGKLVFAQMAAIAAYERDLLAERVRAAQEHRATQGFVPNGRVPYGYEVVTRASAEHWVMPGERGTVRVVPDEAGVVRMIYDWYLRGRRRDAIAADLSGGRPAPRYGWGAEWSENTVKLILENPAYKGIYRWGARRVSWERDREVLGKSVKVRRPDPARPATEIRVPAILDPGVWDAAAARRRQRRQKCYPWRIVSGTWPRFSGMFRCAGCGETMVGGVYLKRGERRYYYACRNCRPTWNAGSPRPEWSTYRAEWLEQALLADIIASARLSGREDAYVATAGFERVGPPGTDVLSEIFRDSRLTGLVVQDPFSVRLAPYGLADAPAAVVEVAVRAWIDRVRNVIASIATDRPLPLHG